MILPSLLAAWLAAAAPPPELPAAPPDWLPPLIVAVDRAMATVESGRRLQAGAGDVPIEPRELPPNGPPVAFLAGEHPVIGVDARRAKALTLIEWELALARERARAAEDPGLRLIECEQAAEQRVLEYTLDRYAASDEFRRALAKSLKRTGAVGRVRAADVELAEGEVSFKDLSLPSRDPDLEAELLARFADDPKEFYWAVEKHLLRAPDAVRLSELETFLWAYAEKLGGIDCQSRARYCTLEGRLIRPELAAAAKAASAGGGLDRAREGLAGFQGEAATKLQGRARAWLKNP